MTARSNSDRALAWENREYYLAIYFLYYNFCRVHMTTKTTPAVKAGLEDAQWNIEQLLYELAAHDQKQWC